MTASDTPTEKSTDISYRLKQLFEAKNLNASSAARELGYSVPSKLYGILQGATAPGYATLTDILAKWPEVSADWLLMGRGQMLHGQPAPAATDAAPTAGRKPGLSVVNSGQVVAITVDAKGEENVELVPIQAQAGYTVQYNEAVFVSELPKYRIPGFERGTFRAFEVSGDSMEPTINHSDIVVASYVDNWRLLIPDDIYVIVTTESVMLKRIRERITSREMTLLLYSDNHYRKPYPIEGSDIVELWRVRGYITSYIPSAPDITTERLWDVIELLGHDRGEVRRYLTESAPNNAPNSQ